MRISVNGITINYTLEGSAESPAVTFSHSLGANMSMWDEQVRLLSGRYRVCRYDIRGHGASDTPEGPYKLRDLTEDIRGLLQALEIRRTHFVGLSLGGIIGQMLALESPSLIDGLVLGNTTSRLPPEARPVWDERARIALSQGMKPIAAITVPRWLTDGFRKASPKIAEQIGEMILSTNPAGYVNCYRAIEEFDVTERLRQIKSPTLVIAGADDPATTTADAKEIHERIGGSAFLVLSPAAHLSNIEQPKRFSEALLQFLEGVDRQTRSGTATSG